MLLTRIKRRLIRTVGNPRAFGTRPLPADTDPAALAADSIVPFRCNLCGTRNAVAFSQLSREAPSCAGCESSVRFRAIAHLLTSELFGVDTAIVDLPKRKDVVGIGLSDAPAYAIPLARKLSYTNTYFHAEPRVDIANVPPGMCGRYDFLIASDVFEHVAPPVSRAFVNARRILKPGGVFVFTVPFELDGDTVEHFPTLGDFRTAQENGRWTLYNRTGDGREEAFNDLVFHGGPGTTLEMRVFSRAALEREFDNAGFSSLRIAAEPCLARGIVWSDTWSVPMVARA